VQRLLVAGLDLAWVGVLTPGWPALPGLTVTFWDEEGRVLYRQPERDRWLGRLEPDAPITRAVLANRASEAFEAADLDGVTRVFALAHSREHPGRSLAISVGIERETLTAPADRRLALALAALLVVGGLALFAMLFIAERLVRRPAAALARASVRLAEGDLSVRVPEFGGELSALAVTFNRMAERLNMTLASRAELEREVGERKRIEEQLRDSEARARNIVGSALDAIILIDHGGRVVEFNPSAVRVFGYSRSNALGKELAELVIPPALREAHRQGLARYLRTGKSEVMGRRIEMQALRADGREFPAELTVVPVADVEPQIFAGFVRDISERRRAQEALRESEAHSRAILESALDAIVVNDDRGRITEFNPSAERIFGWSREQAIGRDLAELIIPDRLRHMHRDDLVSGVPQFQGRRVEVVALHADGHEFPIELTVQRIERDGRPFFAAFMRDISERRRAEEALSESEGELRTIFDSVQDGILVADAQTRRFQKANASIIRMLGYRLDELLDLTVEAIHPEKDFPNVVHEFERLVKGEIRIAPNLPVKRKDGTVFHADITAAPVTLRGQGCLLGVFRDITERKQTEGELKRRAAEIELKNRLLEEANRHKSEFLAAISHELRTPLNGVIGFADLLQAGTAGRLDARQAEYVAEIRASGEQLRDLVDTILDMMRIDSAEITSNPEPVEIRAALAERVAAHRKAAETRDVTIGLQVAPDAGNAELDPRALRRMFDALLDNAIKFNREGGSVAVSARRAGGWLEIAVTDTGIGIARENLVKIFRPLVQLDAGLARTYGGVGLGLALARRLAELQGGTIKVESEPGKGSTFTLRFPVEGRT
jgi:PAS domain S-box-containing protein